VRVASSEKLELLNLAIKTQRNPKEDTAEQTQ
jgi:hypothetical protein